jgi:hypothetical protein
VTMSASTPLEWGRNAPWARISRAAGPRWRDFSAAYNPGISDQG